MKLLVVSQYFWPESFRINELSAALASRGHQVTVLTGVPNYPTGTVFSAYSAAPKDFAEYEGVRIVRVPMLPRGRGKLGLLLNYVSFALSASLVGAWKLRGQAFDRIFTCQLSPVTVGIPSALLRYLKNAPHVFWVLDLWPGTLEAVGVIRAPWILNLVGKLVQFIYSRCDLILAQSNSFVDNIRRYAGSNIPVEYFPAWSEAVFEDALPRPAPEVACRPDLFTIVFAGNMGEAQDFPAILRAAQLLGDRADIRWVVVGDGSVAHWVANQVLEKGLSDRVVLTGRFGLERMPEFFAHADALLVSLKDEPIFGMTIPGKLQAYLAVGKPILAMLNGEGAKVVQDANAGFVCPAGDFEGLAENVRRLVNMPRMEREQIGNNGKQASASTFNRENLLDALEERLLRLASSANRH
jgi:colanic acid biosynthesis glycosyl transferase WcaI